MARIRNLATLAALAVAEYLLAVAAEENGSPIEGAGRYPYSPAAATAALARKADYPKSRLVPLVAEVFYEENGRRSPLPKSAAKGRKSLAAAVATRRDKGGRLGRWDVIAYSASETLGRPVAVAAVKALYEEARGEGSRARSYTGRGTRAGAVETRYDEVAELGLAE